MEPQILQNELQAKILVAGAAVEAPAFALTAPISFWGGVDPQTGLIANVRHPQYGQSVSGKVLCLPATVGSSSAAAVLLELVHSNRAPAAIILHEPDAILLLGLIVAEEMGRQSRLPINWIAGRILCWISINSISASKERSEFYKKRAGISGSFYVFNIVSRGQRD